MNDGDLGALAVKITYKEQDEPESFFVLHVEVAVPHGVRPVLEAMNHEAQRERSTPRPHQGSTMAANDEGEGVPTPPVYGARCCVFKIPER